ncbi:hypothetical protein [Pleomorphochaeta sp. DL1XJH-081]|uniref:hypothetical protein n=1 Tax=Pleomorphochaeta sp. DL1XJH-081 TaxID=3409690 RepID=UPI003BB7B4B2
MKRVILTLMAIFMVAAPVSAANTGIGESGNPYLYIASGMDSDYFQFNDKGVFVPQTDPPAELKKGWIILSGQEPVTIKGRYTTIVLQRESILTIGSARVDSPSYYLVAGSASFLVDKPFSGTFEVSTPVGIYKLEGPGEMFVSSDYAELIFSLGGEIEVMNAITRQISDVPPYTYMNLADPFLHTKQISQQTYDTLSINPNKGSIKTLPSASVEDGITFKAPAPLFDVPQIPEEPEVEKEVAVPTVESSKITPKDTPIEATVTVPLTIEGEKELQAKEIVVTDAPSEGLSLKVSITTDSESQTDTSAQPSEVPQEAFDFYIVHTNDASGQLSGEGIGYARLATLLDWGRSVSDKHLVLDAGNTVSGTPIVDAFEGEPVAVLLDMLGYDAIAPGAADYAFGLDRLQEAARLASEYSDLDILAANVFDETGNALFTPYEIYDFDEFSVGVIGISVPPRTIDGVVYLNDTIIDQAQTLLDEVVEKADLVVLLGNIAENSGITSSDIANALEGIDLIIDGEIASTPAGGRTVGDTLIVNAGGELSSVGIVAAHVLGDEVKSLYANRITVEDVNNPTASTLAAQFGIESVPANREVQQYITSQEARFAALEKTIVPKAPSVEVSVEEEPVETAITEPVEDVKKGDEALTIKEPLGIVSGSPTTAEETVDWGVTTRFTLSRDGFTNSATPKMGVSINPFYHRNSFELGLQAFFLTDGSPFSPSTYTISNIIDGEGIATTLSSAMRFLDYVKYGEKEYPFYLVADDSTPIAFGNRILVDNLGVATGPFEEHLGLYSSAEIGRFGIELFADDLYLTKWLDGDSQTGGGRLSFDISPNFNLALSSMLTADRGRNIDAYPALDLTWKIKNERRLRFDAFATAATKVEMNPFSFDTVYNASGSGISGKLPNFLFAGGVDLHTLKWDARFVGAVQNSSDGLLSLGSFNQTTYSGSRMLDSSAGVYYTIGSELGYRGEHLGFTTSWYLPIDQDFSKIVKIDGTQTTGDRFAIEATYTGANFQGAVGFRRVGLLSAIDNLFTSGNFTSAAIEMVKSENEGLERNSQPYVALRYTNGLFGIFGDLSMVPSNPDNPGGSYTPRVNLGASVTIGKQAISEATDPTIGGAVFDDESNFSGTISTAYTRNFVSDTSDTHYLTIKPIISYTKDDSFSIGIGPQISIDFSDIELYAHDDSPFGFGKDYPSTVGKLYDSLTDSLSLIDHVNIGEEDDTFHLAIGRDISTSMGPLVKQVTTRTDSSLDTPLALQAKLDTESFDIDVFMNDITELQLGGVRFGIAPFKSYGAEFGLSAIGSAKLTDSDKQIALLPSFDLNLPIVHGENLSFDAQGSFTTMLGYKAGTGFVQNFFDSSASTFLGKFNNYLFTGGLDMQAGAFGMGIDLAMQEGGISYGMFNSLYLREQNSLVTALDVENPANDPRSFTITAEMDWQKDKFALGASYLMPLSADFQADTDNDLFTVSSTLDLSWFDLELAYGKRGFLGGIEDVLSGSSGSLLSRARTFLFDETSAISAGIAVTQGPMTFKATLSSLASFITPVGSWNLQNESVTSPALTLGVDINLF